MQHIGARHISISWLVDVSSVTLATAPWWDTMQHCRSLHPPIPQKMKLFQRAKTLLFRRNLANISSLLVVTFPFVVSYIQLCFCILTLINFVSWIERHYRFTIELAKPRMAELWVQGYLTAAIFSDRGALRNIDLTPKGTARLEHGSTYQVVVTNPHDLGDRIRKVELNWAHEMNVLEPRSLCLFWCNDHLYVKSLMVDSMQMPSRE